MGGGCIDCSIEKRKEKKRKEKKRKELVIIAPLKEKKDFGISLLATHGTGPDGTCGARDTFPVYRVTAYGSLWLPGPGSPQPGVNRTAAVLKEMNDKMVSQKVSKVDGTCFSTNL